MKIPCGCTKKHTGGDAKQLIKFYWPYTSSDLASKKILESCQSQYNYNLTCACV